MSELLNSILEIQKANTTSQINSKYIKLYETLYEETIQSIKEHAKESSNQFLDIEFFEYCLFDGLDKKDKNYKQIVRMMDWLVNRLEQDCFYVVRHVEYDASEEEYLIWINIHWADKLEVKF
jgi:hypothetical protein